MREFKLVYEVAVIILHIRESIYIRSLCKLFDIAISAPVLTQISHNLPGGREYATSARLLTRAHSRSVCNTTHTLHTTAPSVDHALGQVSEKSCSGWVRIKS